MSIFDRVDPVSRRDFLAFSAKALLGVSLVPLLAPALRADGGPASRLGSSPRRPTAKNVIYLYMAGGMSHLNTFDTKPGAATQGPTETIKTTADGLTLSQHFPLLAKQGKR